jgi:hypothetical protein
MTTIEWWDKCGAIELSGSGSGNTKSMSGCLSNSNSAMRVRFSLRTLLIAFPIFAVACCWLALPSLRARQFVSAIESKNYARADGMFIDRKDRFIVALMEDRPVRDLHASWRTPTFRERICGMCDATVTDYGLRGTDEKGFDISIDGYMYTIVATPWGVRKKDRYKPISGGSFGGL